MDESLARKIINYKPDQTAIDIIRKTRILLLVGPTGAGKDSLKDKLLETGEYHHIVSHTTRKPRINHGILEQDGLEYHFIDLETADRMLDTHKYVEAKFYSGNVYGTSVAEIQRAHDEGKIALTDVEVQGVTEYKKLDKNVMAAFLLPPDFKTWQERLQRRYGDVVDAEDALIRMRTALDEIEQLLTTDNYAAVVNDDMQTALDEIHAYVADGIHDPAQERHGREVAAELTADIQAYLEANSWHS